MGSRLRLGHVLRRGVTLLLLAVLVLSWASNTGTASATGTSSKNVVPLMLARANHTGTLYVVGSVPCPRSLCLRLYRAYDTVESTIDPDPTFTKVTLPPVRAIAGRVTGSLLGLVFASALIGYALVGSSQAQLLYATFDGATTWHKVKIPVGDSIDGLTATGDHLYALFSNCTKRKRGCVDFQLDHSTLSARTWSGATIPFTSFDEGYSAGTIGAYGENVFFCEQSKSAPLLFTSHNGGVTFTKSVHAKLVSVSGCDLTAVSTKEVWAECPTGMLASFYFSSDAGRTWTWHPLVRREYSNTGGGFFATAGYDFAYLDSGNTPRNIYRLNVGARRVHAIGELACPAVDSAVFMSVFHAYAICDTNGMTTRLVRTIDGGTTWQRVTTW